MTNIAALEYLKWIEKTLCLFCSILFWMDEMRSQKYFGEKILYITKTHAKILNLFMNYSKLVIRQKLQFFLQEIILVQMKMLKII